MKLGRHLLHSSTRMHAQAPQHDHLVVLLVVLVFLLRTESLVDNASLDSPGAGVAGQMPSCCSCIEGIP